MEEPMRNEILAVIAVSAASFAMAEDANPDVNPNIWFDGTDERVCIIDPLLQDAYEKEGCSFWYDVDDRKNDQGGSYALYPFDTSGYNGSLIAPEIEKLGYVTIWYHLEDPTLTGQTDEYPYNFVKFGFDMVPGSSGTLDISSTGGLCATYTSQIDVELEVNTEKSGNTPCFAKLPRTQEPKTVDKAIKDFAQATWAADSNKLASCAEAFKEARSVMFKLDGRASATDGVLRIFEVGPKGTCKGGKTIKDEGYYANFACKSDGEGHAACRLCAGPDGCSSKLGGMNAVSFASVSVTDRLVTLNGLGQNVQYRLFDMQGNTVHSGFAAGHIDFSGVKSGSYLLKVKGNLELTRKIVLK